MDSFTHVSVTSLKDVVPSMTAIRDRARALEAQLQKRSSAPPDAPMPDAGAAAPTAPNATDDTMSSLRNRITELERLLSLTTDRASRLQEAGSRAGLELAREREARADQQREIDGLRDALARSRAETELALSALRDARVALHMLERQAA